MNYEVIKLSIIFAVYHENFNFSHVLMFGVKFLSFFYGVVDKINYAQDKIRSLNV